MKALDCFRYMYRIYKHNNSRLKAFFMAARDAAKPLPF